MPTGELALAQTLFDGQFSPAFLDGDVEDNGSSVASLSFDQGGFLDTLGSSDDAAGYSFPSCNRSATSPLQNTTSMRLLLQTAHQQRKSAMTLRGGNCEVFHIKTVLSGAPKR